MNTPSNTVDALADWVYGRSSYPISYRKLVAGTRAKEDQYRDMVQALPRAKPGQQIDVLEPGPSNIPLLLNAVCEAGLEIDRYRFTGLDPYPRMHPPDMEMLTGSVSNIPLPDQSVDCVVMSSVLFFVSDCQRAIHECTRVLRPGGRLILSEPDIDCADTLTKSIFQYELDCIRRDVFAKHSGWIGGVLYRWQAFAVVASRLPYLIPTLQINKRILRDQRGRAGFTAEQLIDYLSQAGLTLIESKRTYAGAYFLLSANKSLEMGR